MKRIILTVFIGVVFLLNTTAQVNYHITGTIDRKDVTKLYLYNGKIIFDSITV
ncbi:MAG: hypothetical protein HXX14_07005, partial [Bacteroidetes bacterium]|nr:hypothetical protein [Bacteroidota bacterium]